MCILFLGSLWVGVFFVVVLIIIAKLLLMSAKMSRSSSSVLLSTSATNRLKGLAAFISIKFKTKIKTSFSRN